MACDSMEHHTGYQLMGLKMLDSSNEIWSKLIPIQTVFDDTFKNTQRIEVKMNRILYSL